MRTILVVAVFLLAGVAVLLLRQSGIIQETASNWIFAVLLVLAIGAGVSGWRKSQTVDTAE